MPPLRRWRSQSQRMSQRQGVGQGLFSRVSAEPAAIHLGPTPPDAALVEFHLDLFGLGLSALGKSFPEPRS